MDLEKEIENRGINDMCNIEEPEEKTVISIDLNNNEIKITSYTNIYVLYVNGEEFLHSSDLKKVKELYESLTYYEEVRNDK